MNKKTRNWLFAIFVFAFVVLSVVILFYAFGYSLSNYGLKLQKTGMLDIKTEPSGAGIYLNGQAYNKGWLQFGQNQKKQVTSPAKISNLNPGEYQIRLYSEGYLPWEKKLRVDPGATTYLENVRLFKDSLPYSIVDLNQEDVVASAFSDNLKYFAVIGKQKINIIDLKQKTISANLDRKSQNDQTLTWSADSKFLIADNQVIKPDGSIMASLPTGSINAKFDQSNSDLIYFAHAGAVKTFNLNNQQINTFSSLDKAGYLAKDWLIKDGQVYLLEQNKQSRYWQLELYGQSGEILSKAELNIVSDLSFSHPKSKWINIYDAKNRHLYLVSLGYPLNANYDIKRIEDVNYSSWLDGGKLLIAGEFDLRIWDRDSNKEQFLTRLSSPLNFVSWYTDDNYIIFGAKDRIASLELDNRDGHQITNLSKFNQLNKTALSADGKTIFLEATVGQKYGLYALDIQ